MSLSGISVMRDLSHPASREHESEGGGMGAGSPDILKQGFAPGELLECELAKPQGDLWEVPFSVDDLFELRQLVAGWAAREAMSGEPADELVLSVHEIATNSIRHAGGMGMLRLWRTSDSLVCEVQDAGHITDPALGRVQPGASASESRGLWIANQLCDLVQIRSGTGGTQVRMHKRLV
jgi:anti-sigma regulatory factor (Ser/Thr protein kinase)